VVDGDRRADWRATPVDELKDGPAASDGDRFNAINFLEERYFAKPALVENVLVPRFFLLFSLLDGRYISRGLRPKQMQGKTLLRPFGVDVKVQQELLHHADIHNHEHLHAGGKVVEMLFPMRKAG
jgi:hypothetical protein